MNRQVLGALCCLIVVAAGNQTSVRAQEKIGRRITVTVKLEMEPFVGIIMHPFPPNTASQRVVSWEMVVKTAKRTTKGDEGNETGSLQKRILMAQAAPDEKMLVILTLDIDLFEAPGPVKVKNAPKLSDDERTAQTEAGEYCEHDTESFRAWTALSAIGL